MSCPRSKGADPRTAHLSGIPHAVLPSTTSTSAPVAPFCLVFALDGFSGCLSFIISAWRFISLDHGQVVMFSQSLVFLDFHDSSSMSPCEQACSLMCQGQLRVLHQGVPVYFVTMPLCRFVCTVRGADFGTLLEHLACQSQNLVNKWVRCVRAQAPRADRFAPQTPLRPQMTLHGSSLLETLRTGGWEWCQLERSDLKSLAFWLCVSRCQC